MKRIRSIALVIGLSAVGCSPFQSNHFGHIVKTPPATKTGEQAAPTAVTRLLPSEQLSEKNAQAQAELLSQTLKKESGQIETAQRKPAEGDVR